MNGDDHCKGRLGREAGDESDPVVDGRRRRRRRRQRQHVVASVGRKPSSTMDRRDRKFVLGRRWMAVTRWREGKQGRAPRQVVVDEGRTGRMDQQEESSTWPLANQRTETIFDRRLGDH
jgi:hypothetical protein